MKSIHATFLGTMSLLIAGTLSFAGTETKSYQVIATTKAIPNIIYADKIADLGGVASHYSLKVIQYTEPGSPGVRVVIGAVAGEFDEVTWILPHAFSSISKISLASNLTLEIEGTLMDENYNESDDVVVTAKLTISPPDGEEIAPFLERTMNVQEEILK